MFAGWFGAGEETVDRLIARKSYRKAAELIHRELDTHRGDARLRQQLADVFALDGKPKEAAALLEELAVDFASRGFTVKAIALLKKIQRLDPHRPGIDERLDSMARTRETEITGRPVLHKAVEAAADEPVIDMEEIEEVGVDVEPIESVAARENREEEGAPQGGGLSRTPLFAGFSEDELVAIIQGLELQSFEPGDIVVAAGDPGGSLFVVASGALKAFVRGDDGRLFVATILSDGDFFGEISLLTGERRTATVTAATSCELLELDRGTLDRLSAAQPHIRETLEEFAEKRRARRG
jgi:cAMP-dependent protein kinase regulator